jgi:hypothetical protein
MLALGKLCISAGIFSLDIGSGSGLHSLAALQMGARVTSFDFDPDSEALENTKPLVKPDGLLYIAIYNDGGETSQMWLKRKQRCCSLPKILKLFYFLYVYESHEIKKMFKSIKKSKSSDYFESWTAYKRSRGMTRLYDMIDWLGGPPYVTLNTPGAIPLRGTKLLRHVRLELTKSLLYCFAHIPVTQRGKMEIFGPVKIIKLTISLTQLLNEIRFDFNSCHPVGVAKVHQTLQVPQFLVCIQLNISLAREDHENKFYTLIS